MLRASIARISNPIVWRLPGRGARMLFSFAHAEAASRMDLLAAARHTPSLERRALYVRHAIDEARHATMFELRSAELRAARRTAAARRGARRQRSAVRAPGRAAASWRSCTRRGARPPAVRGLSRVLRAHAATIACARCSTPMLADERATRPTPRELLRRAGRQRARAARAALRRAAAWEAWRLWRRSGRALARRRCTP